MVNQKAENLLNLALDTPENVRVRTEELNVGYDPDQRTWEVIVTYHGDLEMRLRMEFPEVQIYPLMNQYGILTIPEGQVDSVLSIEEIEYAEKPKKLYFAVNQARAASCLLPVQTGVDGLTGKGVLVGILDSGIDYFHKDFRNEDGSTRILSLQDQILGQTFTKEEIDAALFQGRRDQASELVPSVDRTGHGTAVAGIAAGNGRESDGRYRGVAYESDLLVVRLGIPDPDGFPRTTEVMKGLDFLVQKALEWNRPIAVNMSFGNTYGSHDGSSLFERYIDQMADVGRNVIVIGTGNEGDRAGHMMGNFFEEKPGDGRIGSTERAESRVIELSTAPYETGFSVQIWKNYEDDFSVFLTNPSGTVTEQISELRTPYTVQIGDTEILVYYGVPSPFSTAQEIYMEFLPKNTYVESGIWKFTLIPEHIVEGRFDLWLPSAGVLNRATRFLRPTPDTTLTVPATALRPVSVGAYDDSFRIYAPFSGRGYTREYEITKPDLAAPGVGIVTTQKGGGYAPVTGTSFAAPFVTGTAALLMEWGIVRGNDPFLYGDKVKAYLRKGARKLPGESRYPNPQIGYGALCAADSLPD